MNRLKRIASCLWWAPAFLMMVLTSFTPPSRIRVRDLRVFHNELAQNSKGYAAWNAYFWIVFVAWTVWAFVLFSGS